MEEPAGSMNMYRAPVSAGPPQIAGSQTPFYVVSRPKLVLLFFGTFGLYGVYWFFAHWKQHRALTGDKLSPFWRAVFAIFFAHELFGYFREKAQSTAFASRWSLKNMATLYVVLAIVAGMIRYSGATLGSFSSTDTLGLMLSFTTVVPLVVAQRAANAASGDPQGSSNSGLTLKNFAFLGLGGLFWLLFILSYLPQDY